MKIIGISELKNIISDNIKDRELNYVIFGASGYGRKFFEYIKELGIKIKYFCDNDSNKWGKDIDGIPIKSPNVLRKDEKQIIFIASSYFREIAEQLKDIDEKNIYFCDIFVEKMRMEVIENDYKESIILEDIEANQIIIDKINDNKPTMITRLGSVELEIIASILKKENLNDNLRVCAINNAGIFPNDDDGLNQFSYEFINSLRNVDIMAVWFNRDEKYVLDKCCPKNIELINLSPLMPLGLDLPWTKALAGKKVLVIHPFEKSIVKQFLNREKLFKNHNMLPAFELKTLKAVQSIGGNSDFASWVEALNFMKDKIENIDFDIALIGAGAYGLPLASFIKSKGKTAIHIGGALQVLFGITGKRWEHDIDISSYINSEYWIRPNANEKPKLFKNVEGGCYW